ncbi:DUF3397 family protein [Ureibacillus manganicus]|uniref:DUF3397 domain-containing protein n=1 Tax=Ureibacillus manganicus DSM 26584 TaxID=1384049 RepID=A0A0A3I6P3_9BACL|nr:DUF3397 family protein [Ureibacillus manganicus]KGR80451.1 hypothetical protein CD29_00735 [Ureibacillus manganicus DSM 26584]
MSILLYLVSFIILFPILLLIGVYSICRSRKVSKVKSFGLAADATTFVLFFSIPLFISSLWNINVSAYVICSAILIAIIFTFFDWKTKKEIEILPLMKKIWRFLFVVFIVVYILIWIVGMLYKIVTYVFLT